MVASWQPIKPKGRHLEKKKAGWMEWKSKSGTLGKEKGRRGKVKQSNRREVGGLVVFNQMGVIISV